MNDVVVTMPRDDFECFMQRDGITEEMIYFTE
jgi:hypothetical protein